MQKIFKILFATLCGFLLGGVCLHIVGIDVNLAYSKLYATMFGSIKNIINCFIYTTPYLLTALAFGISAKGGIFNIGVEGEFIVSSLAACVCGIFFSSLPSFILVPLCVSIGIIVSILFSFIVYILKSHFNIHEIFAMIITNYIALHFSNFIINTPLIKSGNGADTSKIISSNAIICLDIETLSKYNLPTNMNFSFIVAVILSIIIYLIFKYLSVGHNIINVGLNKEAAILSGININKTNFYTMTLSALVSGFAGSIYMISIGKRLSVLPAFEGYGFTGILISLLSNNNPIVTILSALFFGSLKYAGRSLNIVNAPSQIIDLITSTIVILAASNYYINKRKRNAR